MNSIRRLVEIDENLCRAELTASQRTKYTKRRAQIWEALHPAPPAPVAEKPRPFKTSLRRGRLRKRIEALENATNLVVEQDVPLQEKKHGGARDNQLSNGFASDTAASTGMTKQAINRHLARADALGDTTLDKITGTSLDR